MYNPHRLSSSSNQPSGDQPSGNTQPAPTGTGTSTGTRPSGTVTFLFSDIEGSTKRWEQQRTRMQAAFARQEAIVREAIEAHGGHAYKMIGDAFQAAFPTASQALGAALQAQRALYSERWSDEIGPIDPIRVRMALHTGVTEERGDDYVGPALNRAARLMSAGHGGQVLVSQGTRQLLRDNLPPGVTLRDMGDHRLRDLTEPEHIFQLVAEGLPSDFPPLKTLEGHQNNLPVQTTPLVGRQKEVAFVRQMLLRPDVRLLTLTGVGGIGKTRLALQAAAEMLDDFPDGVFFVNLAPLLEPGLVVPTIATTLGLREAGGQPIADTLREYLKDKQLLLVLDNFEQVLEAAPGVAELVKSIPQLKVLVTSRAAVGLSMEHQYAVPPLGVPDPKKLLGAPGAQDAGVDALSQYDAVLLFIQRAKAVKPNFQVNNANAPAVAEICYRLEGIPLAIELAAARIKVLTPQALLDRLGSRLKLLTGGGRDLPSRQQTLRNTIEWSYDLLSEEEKQLFGRLSVFRGGRTLEAVEEVCNANGDLQVDVLDGITSLVDKSLLYTVEGSDGAGGADGGGETGGGGEPRYWMLETIHEYAGEKLQESRAPFRDGEAEEIRRQHALYFMRLAEEAEGELRGAQQSEWLRRLEDEHDNIRAALQWARETTDRVKGVVEALKDVDEAEEIGLRIAGAIWRFWYRRGYFSEGREQLAGFLQKLEKDEEVTEKEEETIPGARRELGAEMGAYKAKALNGAGVLASCQGNYASARSLYEGSLAIRRELGDKWGIAYSLLNLGGVAQEQGDYASARSLYEESLSLFRETGDKWGIALLLNNLGNMARAQGDYAFASSLYEESLPLFRETGDKWGIASSLLNRGNMAAYQGDYASARSVYEESLPLFRELGDKLGIVYSLNNLGNIAHLQGDQVTARSLHEESLSVFRELGDKGGVAMSLGSLGLVALAQGDYASARSHFDESLTLGRELGDKRGIAVTLVGLSGLTVRKASALSTEGAGGGARAGSTMATEGEHRGDEERKRGLAERGGKLLGAAEALLQSIGAVLDPGDRQIYEHVIATAREELGEEGLEAARQEGRAMSMEAAIEYALEPVADG